MWETQSGKFTTSKKVNIEFFLTEFSATKIVTWKCHVDEYTNVRYDMILGRYILTALEMYLKLSNNVKNFGEGPYKGCLSPMVDERNNDFKSITY